MVPMCGRIALFTPPAHLARFLDAALAAGLDPEGTPSWNVGPQRTLFGVSEHHEARVLDPYRWGLVPSWAKDPSIGNRLFNARAEGVAEKPSFRSAFARRPCVIPVDGFYEWDHRPGQNRQPHFFTRVDQEPVLLAGLYEFWRNPADPNPEPLATCTIITTTPGVDMDEIHDRMPVVLQLGDVETWLNVAEHSPDERLLLLRPAPKGTLTHYGVASAVGSVKNDGPELTEPVKPQSLF
jgi:putative SOS response-associated peptidase YedK